MNRVEFPVEGTGVWNNRLRPRVKKEPTVRPVSYTNNHHSNVIVKCPNVKKESLINDLKRKVKSKDPGNNNLGEEKDRRKKKSDVSRSSPGNVSLKIHQENNIKVGSKLNLMNPKPRTVKERMQNWEVLKALNEHHEDDFFEDNEVLKTVRCSLLESRSSLSSSESFSFSSPSTETLSPLRKLRREETPEWYTSWVEETSLNLDYMGTFKHNAYIHRQLKQQNKSLRSSASKVISQVASSSRMKDHLTSSSNQIAVLSSGLVRQEEDDEEQCEEYFSEDD